LSLRDGTPLHRTMFPILLLLWAGAQLWPHPPAFAGDEPPKPPAPLQPPGAQAPHPGSPPDSAVLAAQETSSLISRLTSQGEPGLAVKLCLDHLTKKPNNAKMRSFLSQAYVARDRICLPLPPRAEAFQQIGEEFPHCELVIVPPATRDTVAAAFQAQMALAPDDIQSHFLMIDFELKYGTPQGVSQQIEGLAPFDDPQAIDEIQYHWMEQLVQIKRPPLLAVIARHFVQMDPATLDCAELERIINSLVRVGDFDGAVAAIGRVPADGTCDERLFPTISTALMLSGRYQDLWNHTKSPAIKLETIIYYQYALTAVLAAAHFDLASARKRLAHEQINAKAYPKGARRVLTELGSILDRPRAPAKRWVDLSQDSLLADTRFADVRFLLHSLATQSHPGSESSNLALAEELVRRDFPLLAAFRFEALAGGRNAGIDRRWDPRRPGLLRRAAEYSFAAEDDGSCRALLAEIPERTAEDELMVGVAALRGGDFDAARVALERAQVQARVPAMRAAVERLLAMAAVTAP